MIVSPNVRCKDCGWKRFEPCEACADTTARKHQANTGHTVNVTPADPRDYEWTPPRLQSFIASTRWPRR